MQRGHDLPGINRTNPTHFQAGLLTPGSSSLLRLPVCSSNSDIFATFVSGYSGGPVPDLHRVPFSSLVKPENIGLLYRTFPDMSIRGQAIGWNGDEGCSASIMFHKPNDTNNLQICYKDIYMHSWLVTIELMEHNQHLTCMNLLGI